MNLLHVEQYWLSPSELRFAVERGDIIEVHTVSLGKITTTRKKFYAALAGLEPWAIPKADPENVARPVGRPRKTAHVAPAA